MTEKTIYDRLLAAQKKIEPVSKDANNPFFKSSYATLGAVIDAVKAILNEEGIIVIQPIMDNKVFTYLVGGGTENEMIKDGGTPIICSKPNDPQAQGSAITYARRYGLMSLLCLSAEDDDGEKATTHTSPTTSRQTKTVQQSTTTDYGKCSRCGSPNKWSTLKNKAYCGAMCWNNPKQEMPTKVVDEVTDEVMDQISEMPF